MIKTFKIHKNRDN